MLNEDIEERIRDLAQAHPTPFYAYDLSAMRKRVQLLRDRISSDFEIFYSAKANSHLKILNLMNAEGLSVDVASLRELERALSAGFAADRISFTGPGKRTQEIARAIELNIGAIVFESEEELQEIDEQAIKQGRRARVVARLSPAQRVGHTGRLVVDEPTQFGFNEQSLESLIQTLLKAKNINLIGTHSHVQSQILQLEHILRNFEFALENSILFQSKLRAESAFKFSSPVLRVSLGGGIGIPYSHKVQAFDFDRFAIELRHLTSRYSGLGPLGVPMQFAMELGRYLVGESGYFVSRILRKKIVPSKGRSLLFAIADGGYSQCQIACGVGQLVRTNLPYVVLKAHGGRRAAGSENVSVAGSTCYTHDILLREVLIDGIDAGDLLIVKNVGAYGKQFSPAEFLLQPDAAEYFLGEE